MLEVMVKCLSRLREIRLFIRTEENVSFPQYSLHSPSVRTCELTGAKPLYQKHFKDWGRRLLP